MIFGRSFSIMPFLILIPFKTVGLVFRMQPFLNYGFYQ